jgi:hypothetical protein
VAITAEAEIENAPSAVGGPPANGERPTANGFWQRIRDFFQR